MNNITNDYYIDQLKDIKNELNSYIHPKADPKIMALKAYDKLNKLINSLEIQDRTGCMNNEFIAYEYGQYLRRFSSMEDARNDTFEALTKDLLLTLKKLTEENE